jgi:hypothetical protein
MSASHRRKGNPKGQLPQRPSLEHLRRRAKRLLRAAQSGDQGALQRLESAEPTLDRSRIKLAVAQLAIAREHGSSSWPRLVEEVRSSADGELRAKTEEVRFLARKYAASLDCSGEAVRALGRSRSATALVEALTPLCHRDVVAGLVSVSDPRKRLEIVAEALRSMMRGDWDLCETSRVRDPIDPACAPAWLVVVDEHEPVGLLGRRFAVGPGETVVGRATRSDIRLPLESVSRRHCVIRATDDGFELCDEGSTNGVFLNDGPQRIEHAPLRHEDRIEIGRLILEFQRTDA